MAVVHEHLHLHSHVGLMGHLGVSGRVPWLTDTEGSLSVCFIRETEVGDLSHFAIVQTLKTNVTLFGPFYLDPKLSEQCTLVIEKNNTKRKKNHQHCSDYT